MLKRYEKMAITALVVLGLAVMSFAHRADVRRNANEFEALSRSASGAIFLTPDNKGPRRFICSGTSIQIPGPLQFKHPWEAVESLGLATEDKDGHVTVNPPNTTDAYFLTARHCVVNSDGTALGPEEVSFTSNEAGPFYTAVPWKVSATDDVAILRIVNGAGLPAVRLGTEYELQTHERLTNYTFALSLGLMPVELEAIGPRYGHLPEKGWYPEWANSMPVAGPIAPGSSGSGEFSPQQRALVGVTVGLITGTGFGVAEPVSTVWRLLVDPTATAPVWNAPINISEDEMHAKFGKDHTFMLTVHGGNPTFTQGGYKWHVDTLGLELSDVYYDVPVYIEKRGDSYALVSTYTDDETPADSDSLILELKGKA